MLQKVKGTKDYFFKEQELFDYIASVAKNVSELYSYSHCSTPIFEFSQLFSRVLGDSSDVVNKEMYSFLDRNNESLTLRPEFTASICRAFISNSMYQEVPLRLFSYGPLFRYEQPQTGRMRQFHQINYEVVGVRNPLVDSELIKIFAMIVRALGLEDKVCLEINSLGCQESRTKYRNALVSFLQDHKENLSEDSKVRLEKNPIRILDSKSEQDKKIIVDAPLLFEYLSSESMDYFNLVLEDLDRFDVKYNINKKLVRGLDYYCDTVFEFTTDLLGAQNAVGGGGRYDNLIGSLGGKPTPAMGFAAGMERLMLLVKEPPVTKNLVAIIPIGNNLNNARILAEELRENNIAVYLEPQEAAPGKRMKKADKFEASHAIFLGEDEIGSGKIKLRNMKNGSEKLISKEEFYNEFRRKSQ